MKLPSKEQFNFKECEIAGDLCWLITPKDMGTDWSDENFRFRSVIVRQKDNHVISQGFGKFTNFGEKPNFQAWNNDWKFEARHKLDGSLLIVSRYKDQWILRTRGTVDARSLPNGHEIDELLVKYKEFFDCDFAKDSHHSFLFEWTTPNNIIVLREHSEPTLTLLGIVTNDDCKYLEQNTVDELNDYYNRIFNRPTKYVYNSVAECIADVKAWEGKEGVVIYSPDYQTMKKIKSDLYNEAHKVATGLTTIDHVIDLFLSSPRFTKYSEFYNYVETVIDYEVAENIKDHILKICVAYSKVVDKINRVSVVVENVRSGFTRKEQALEFQNHYSDWRLPVAFSLLDNRELSDKVVKTAIISELIV